MSARNSKFCCRLETNGWRWLAKLCFVLSVISLLLAYVIRTIGWIQKQRDGSAPQDGDESKSAFFSAVFSNPLRYFTEEDSGQAAKPLREEYPRLWSILWHLDSYAETITFFTVDKIVDAVHSCLVFFKDIAYDGLFLMMSYVGLLCHNVTSMFNIRKSFHSITFSPNPSIALLLISVSLIVLVLIVFLYIKFHRRGNNGEFSSSSRSREGRVAPSGECHKPKPRYSTHHGFSYKNLLTRNVVWLFLLCLFISIPWEFIRIYQAEVAKKASVTLQGMPPECVPQSMTTWQSIQAWLSWHLSWGHDPCEKYHHALLVDPLWEVTPMMVFSSAFTRCITKPLEVACSTIGACMRLLFREIPAQWQPIIMTLLCAVVIMVILMVCSYRVTLPLFLRIEPSQKTPIVIRTCTNKRCLKAAGGNTKTNFTSRHHVNSLADNSICEENYRHGQSDLSSSYSYPDRGCYSLEWSRDSETENDSSLQNSR